MRYFLEGTNTVFGFQLGGMRNSINFISCYKCVKIKKGEDYKNEISKAVKHSSLQNVQVLVLSEFDEDRNPNF